MRLYAKLRGHDREGDWMRRFWKVGVAVPLVVAVLWGLGIPGRAAPGGPDAAAAVAARARAAEAATAAKLAGGLALAPKRRPTVSLTFPGTQLDAKIWDTCTTSDTPTGCTNFGNKEYEWYMPSQDRVSGGVLSLVAQRIPTLGKNKENRPREYGCRSGLVSTYRSLKFEYGFLQVVAKIPHGRGLWPALWLAAANGQWPPEMDLIEDWSSHFSSAFFHPFPATVNQQVADDVPQSLTDGWQTYSLAWTKTKMKFYIGDKLVMVTTKRIPHQKMYFIADVATFEKTSADNCNGKMEIRSVKYWKN